MMFWMRRPASKNLIGMTLFLLLALLFVFVIVLTLSRTAPALFGGGESKVEALTLILLRDQLLLFLSPLLATILVATYYDRMPLAWTGLGIHQWMPREIALGVALGLGMATLVWLPVVFRGSVEIGNFGSWSALLLWGAILLGNAAGEEILFRGYLYQRIVEIIGPVAGTLLVSGGFAVAHLGNPGISGIAVVNIFLAGILFSVCWLVSGSLWTSIGVHAAWNITLALGFGLPMSGIVTGTSLLQTVSSGTVVWTGGAFGPEGGIVTTAVLLLGGGAFFSLAGRQFSPYTFSRIFWGVHRRKMRKFRSNVDQDNSSPRTRDS